MKNQAIFMKDKNIKFYRKDILEKLRLNKIKTPELDFEVLICYALNKSKEWMYTNPDYKLSKKEDRRLNRLVLKRIDNTPVAYLVKNKEFYGLNFFVNKNVLIPRPETEIIIDEAIKTGKKYKGKTTIIDVGTGSGAIIVSIAKNVSKKNISFFGTDISRRTLYVSSKNAKRHKVNKKISFINGDLLNPFLKQVKVKKIKGSNLIITANLPYLTPSQVKNEKSIQYEPKIALISGQDGLKDYRVFFKQSRRFSPLLLLNLTQVKQKNY